MEEMDGCHRCDCVIPLYTPYAKICEHCGYAYCRDCVEKTPAPKLERVLFEWADYDTWVCIWCEYDMEFGSERGG
jgi:hypothetical protein